MIILLKNDAAKSEVKSIVREVIGAGFGRVTPVHGDSNTTINCIGQLADDRKQSLKSRLESLPAVEAIMLVDTPLRLTSRKYHPENSIVRVNGTVLGGSTIVVIGGPCAVENRAQIFTAADAVKRSGGDMLRGGAFKPRTSPYEFQGLGEKGLKLLAQAKRRTGLPIVTEVMCPAEVSLVAKYADILQVGTRNMQNYKLLEAIGRTKVPVILKRGLAATLKELLSAAEYIMAGGNSRVILCLRGVGGSLFASGGPTRNILDLGDLPELKRMTHLPVLYDPSHACGRRDMIERISLAAVCAGADGLLIEVHPDPDKARCDGAQSLDPDGFSVLVKKVRQVAGIVGRS